MSAPGKDANVPLAQYPTPRSTISTFSGRTATNGSASSPLDANDLPSHIPKIYRNLSGLSRQESHDGFSWSRVNRDIGGYPKLASHLGQLRGNAILRQFSGLNVRHLLWLHNEILELEEELYLLEKENKVGDDGLPRTHHDLKLASRENEHGLERKQLDVMAELRGKQKEYNGLLLQHADLNRLQKPSLDDVIGLRHHIEKDHSNEWWMDHIEGTPWQIADRKGQEIETDLIFLSHESDHEGSPFTNFLVATLRFMERIKAKLFTQHRTDGDHGRVVSDDAILKWSGHVSTIVASTLPSISIVALYYIPTMPWRLVFIVLWSLVFSFCLTVFSSATAAQVFSASTGMAAVQSVFVGITTN